ncbi:hypothetical protein EYC80_005970 [Monilinia laxa]|uniref:Uncharacterized protein n=1 Tax=Monilinia laxa TaxID=61186 RepID=A0A5N6KFR1_MONLA|nr:hypothetical protein EYC80_005970 [Monilinia laxa]
MKVRQSYIINGIHLKSLVRLKYKVSPPDLHFTPLSMIRPQSTINQGYWWSVLKKDCKIYANVKLSIPR